MKKFWVMGLAALVIAALIVPAAAYAQGNRGTGSVVADGDGMVVIRGNGWVRISGQGHLVITDRAGDAVIEVTYGDPNAATTDAQSAPDVAGRMNFRHFDGEAYVQGSDIVVRMRGTGIHVEAEGTGRVSLRGTGTYAYNGVDGAWKATGQQFSLGSVN